jgi:hypothetical protein
MTAGAVVYLEGGGAEEILNAAAIALKSMLGPYATASRGWSRSLHQEECIGRGQRCNGGAVGIKRNPKSDTRRSGHRLHV